MTRFGYPIEDVALKRGVNPAIKYSEWYAEIDACLAAGGIEDWVRWREDGFDSVVKAEVMKWREYSALIKTHREEAASEAAKRRSK